METNADLVIGRVRAHTTQPTPSQVILRLRLDHLLNSADLRPPTIPPSAILVVRQLADPLPGQLAPWRRSLRPNTAWERAVQHALAGCYGRALRPQQGVIPPGADAVLFIDQGELLACLALDLVRGQAWQRWWWRTLLRSLGGPALRLEYLFRQKVAYLPAALHYLAGWKQVSSVMQALSGDEVGDLLASVMAVYSLPAVADLMAPRQYGSGAQQPAPVAQSPALVADPPAASAAASLAAIFWQYQTLMGQPRRSAIEQIETEVGRVHAALLILGLALHHHPTIVNTPDFRRSFQQWWRSSPHVPHVVNNTGSLSGQMSPIDTTRESPLPPPPSFHEDLPQQEHASGPIQQTPARETARADHSRTGSEEYRAENAIVQDAQLLDIESHASSNGDTLEKLAATSAHVQRTHPSEPVPTSSAELRFEPAGVETELGGLLYLANLMHHLDLPACFDEDWRLSEAMSAWGLLELLGRGLLDHEHEGDRWSTDPIWPVLAALDGRDAGTTPGPSLQAPAHFYLPTAWAAQVEDPYVGACQWASATRYLRLWSQRGYLLAEAPLQQPAAEQCRQLMRSYFPATAGLSLAKGEFDQAPLAPVSSLLAETLNPATARWLERILPCVRLRLRLALGGAAIDDSAVATLLLHHRGRLHVTATHVDLVMGLDEIHLSVRLAGLDRDPGWSPTFGRVILFHFK